MSKLEQMVQAKVTYVQMMHACGAPVGSEKNQQLLTNLLEGTLGAIRIVSTVQPGEAVRLKAILEDHLSADQLSTIMAAVANKVSLSGTPSEAQAQRCYNLDVYMTEEDWSCFLDTQNRSAQILRIARIMAQIGLVRPDEKTFAQAALIATHAHGLDSPNMLLQATRQLKDLYKGLVGEAASQGLTQGPLVYPPDVNVFKDEFPALFQKAYAQQPPVPSKWTPEIRYLILQHATARSSKSGASQGPAGPAIARTRTMLKPQQPQLEDLPGFKWMKPQVFDTCMGPLVRVNTGSYTPEGVVMY